MAWCADMRSQYRVQVFISVTLVLLVVMLVMSFVSVFSDAGLSGGLQPKVLLTLQLTVFNVSDASHTSPSLSDPCAPQPTLSWSTL